MTNQIKYETIEVRIKKQSSNDFKPEERNEIMKKLVKEVKNYYGSKRNIKTEYKKTVNSYGEIVIDKIIIYSVDGVVGGVIYHKDPWTWSLIGGNGELNAKFNFNSNDPSLKDEYQGLARLITNTIKK